MITVSEARAIIKEQIHSFGRESCPTLKSLGRVLQEDVHADRDFPPYNRVSMDGIAIRHTAFTAGRRAFPIAGVAAAGSPQMNLANEEECLEIMTGAVLPTGADTVIRYEDVHIADGIATIQVEDLAPGKNVHLKGLDRPAGSIIMRPGRQISPAEIGVAATVGKTDLLVSRMPKAIIISTGDELVDIDEAPLPHQIRKSNVHRLQATLAMHYIEADTAHLLDDYAEILQKLADIIATYDLIIMSGGVSKGKFDFLPQALDELGVEKLFHRVRQRPGKPFWFGRSPQGATVFALPGNPVSSFMCTTIYLLPWLKASLGLPVQSGARAVLAEDFAFKPDLVYFLQVKTQFDEQGRLLATPVVGNGSGDLANLVDADAFLELPRGRDHFAAGEAFALHPYR